MCSKIGIITCGPSEALVVSGLFHGNKPKVVVGGRTLVFPGLQKVQLLPLNTHTLSIKSNTVYTSQGVPISVTGVAQVKLESKNDEMLMAAAEQFGSKSEKEIADMGNHISECEKKLSLLEPENEELKAAIEDVHDKMNKTVSEASENAEEEARFLKV